MLKNGNKCSYALSSDINNIGYDNFRADSYGSDSNKIPTYKNDDAYVNDNRDTKDTDTKDTDTKDTDTKDTDTKDMDTKDININIYRYKFLDSFTSELYKFSKIHQYDHRKDFKEAWKIWTEENDDITSQEVRRLTELGYDGDVLDKMFKSARYYFRKKNPQKKDPIKRRVYNGLNKELLDSMDNHIEKNIKNTDYKPSDGFDSYCKENTELLKEEIKSFIDKGIFNVKDIQSKVKKTYKNRYFLFINKIN